ncbi:hypothetical protein HanIR_Chr11g0552521 [Helianthus annuus]|nr:hypothetical protein HanIR_Chr11g0552521 [Helianthus annuus]
MPNYIFQRSYLESLYGNVLEILILLMVYQLKGFPLFILAHELRDKCSNEIMFDIGKEVPDKEI